MKNRVAVLRALAACALMLPVTAPASDFVLWALGDGGFPTGGGPDAWYVFPDANAACQSLPLPAPGSVTCEGNYRNLRNNGGPQGVGVCVVDYDCTCASQCNLALNPRFRSVAWFTNWRAKTCPNGTTAQNGRCDTDTAKGKGPCLDCDAQKANPVNAASGNKMQPEAIYPGNGQFALPLFYNSQLGAAYFLNGIFGAQWSTRYLTSVRDSGQGFVAVVRPQGRELQFRTPPSGNVYLRDADVTDSLEKLVNGAGALTGWRFTAHEADEVEEYDAAGKLLRIRDRAGVQQVLSYSTTSTPQAIAPVEGMLIGVTDGFGRQLAFTYNAQRRIATVTDPAGGQYLFEYDGSSGPSGGKNLTKVTFPGGAFRVYFYDEAAQINGGSACSTPSPALLNALTGIQDENGNRHATWTYDCSARVTSSRHAAGADLYTFDYSTGTATTVVDPLSTTSITGLQRTLGVGYSTGTSRPNAAGTGTVSTVFARDANGNLSSRTDLNGNRTNYTYDLARNLETSRTEGLSSSGSSTPQTRTISTQWHATFRLPTAIAEPLRVTTNVYDADGSACGARGALCSRTIQATTDANGAAGFSATPSGAPRVWTYTYNTNGSVLTVNGPRTDVADVTTYTYYANDDADFGKRGQVSSISNALGQTTSITAYNAHGQPLTMVDANGLTTTMTYDARLRLKTRTVGTEVTSYDYDNVGQLTKVTLPDSSFLSYSYDDAHRLTGMQDNLGNAIAYTLDAMGNRTAEQVRDPSSNLVQTRSRVYNNLNRLFQELGAQSQTTEYTYDDQGNVVSVKDPLNKVTANQYDALNRLKQVTDPGTGVTQYGYNGLDALTSVSDPRSLVTGYTVDGLGNLSQQVSPDTGTTANTYDAAGNLLTQTDAKGQVTSYVYDALNRVALITFNDNSKQQYVYDTAVNGIGRLASITELDPSSQQTNQTSYSYDQHGRVTNIATLHAGVTYNLAYSYDGFGRMSGLTYPSGRSVAYGFDSLGRVNSVTTTKPGDSPQPVVSAVAYHPFGGVKSYTLGNGRVYSRSIDLDGRIASYTLADKTFGIGYDAASRIEFITDLANPSNANTYGYDALDRLTSATTPSVPYAYSYDAVGNRTSKTVGATTDTYTYSPTSNRIATVGTRAFVFDANGSTTDDGNNTYVYDTRGRMTQATSSVGTTSYKVNALGQRMRKTNSSTDTVFTYDTAGHLIAETDPGGTVIKRELIYLGDIPVGVVQ